MTTSKTSIIIIDVHFIFWHRTQLEGSISQHNHDGQLTLLDRMSSILFIDYETLTQTHGKISQKFHEL